jgi:hypothetical protein
MGGNICTVELARRGKGGSQPGRRNALFMFSPSTSPQPVTAYSRGVCTSQR